MIKLSRRIGHRGLAAHAPENTLAGIRRARDAGLSWVEIDIRLSADRAAVLSHDASLRRCGGKNISVRNKTALQLSQLPAGCGFAEYAKECVPSLADACILLKRLRMGVVIELKPDTGNETHVVRALADALAIAHPPKVIISSFSEAMLKAARKHLPKIPRAFNCTRANDSTFTSLKQTASGNLHCGANTPHRELKKFASAGFGVYCFTVDCPQTARKLLKAGASGVFTNTGLPE